MWPFESGDERWRQEFVSCVHRALGLEPMSFDDALGTLESARSEALLRFDEECRGSSRDYPPVVSSGSGAGRRSERDADSIAQARWFFECCGRNGHERERAFRRLQVRDGRLACAAALIRANDWVPQIQRLAAARVMQIASGDSARHLFGLLELVLALRDRRRFGASWQTVEAALLDPRWRLERAAARVDENPAVRRFVFELTLRADADTSAVTLEAATRDPSPVIASWAVAAALRSLTGEPLRAVLRCALRSPLARVRAEGLRGYAVADYADGPDVLRAALFDPAQGPRNVAAFELERRHRELALPRWREAFDRREHADAMTAALAEHGDESDQDRLRSRLTHARPRIRALALRGLLRTKAVDGLQLLDAALSDASPQYVGTALDLYARSHEKPARATLERAFLRAGSPVLRARLIGAGRLLGKWDGLAFLLDRYRVASREDEAALQVALRRWQQDFNRGFTPLDAARREEIHRSLAALRIAHPSSRWDTVAYFAN